MGNTKLTGGTKLIAAVKVEYISDVLTNGGIKSKVGRLGRRNDQAGKGCGLGDGRIGEREIAWSEDAVGGFEQRGFKNAGKLADIAWPAVLEQAGEGTRTEDNGPLLVAQAEAIKKVLGERGDIFASLAERRNSETDGSETEGEVGDENTLSGHLAEGSLDQDCSPGRTVLAP